MMRVLLLSGFLHGLNRLPRHWRWPVKAAVFASAAFLVSYPDPRVFVRHAARWRNPSALIQPDSPRLEPMIREIRAMHGLTQLAFGGEDYALGDSPRQQTVPELAGPPAALQIVDLGTSVAVLRRVERYVYERVPYAYDWETWGVSDYLPTLDEVLDMGREDCDGRAVVAASLLAHLGYKAELVADFAHVWVKTEVGETMSPGKRTAVRATDEGVKVDWGWGLVSTMLAAAGYVLSPFPLVRELIVLAVLWALLLHPQTGWRVAAIAAVLLVNGLLLVREGGENWQRPERALQVFGFLQLLAGLTLLWRSGRIRKPRSEP